MNTSAKKWETIDAYHAQFPTGIRKVLESIRKGIQQAAPESEEIISYGMPAFKQGKTLVYYAACKEHIGFYPTPGPIAIFKKELEEYKTSKGAIQFPMSQKLPMTLIQKMVKFRLAEVLEKEKSTKPKKEHVKKQSLHKDILNYNKSQSGIDKAISNLLAETITIGLPLAENKIWHAHPVWFLDGNPIVGYSKQKAGMRLMFWSGADFEEAALNVRGAKFKDASIFYTSVEQIKKNDLLRWLKKSKAIQWDYKNIVKRKGKLVRVN